MRSLFLTLTLCCSVHLLSAQWVQSNGPQGAISYDMESVGGEIWVGTESGLFISGDEGASWMMADFLPPESSVREIFVEGFEILMAVDVVQNDYPDKVPYFYRSIDLGETWEITDLPGELSNYQLAIFRIEDSIFFSNITLFRSDNNGATWQSVQTPKPYSFISCNGEQIIIADFTTMYISHDLGDTWELLANIGSDSEVFFEGSTIITENWMDSIYVSHDLGETWSSLPTPGTTDFWIDNSFVRGASGKLYFLSHHVFVSEDNGYTWTALNTESPNDARALSVLEIQNGENLYCTDKGVFRTIDQGTIWQIAATDLIGSHVLEFKVLPNGDLITNTTIGFFRSTNEGEDWEPMYTSFYIPDLKSVLVKGDSVFIALEGDKLLLSTDNLYTADSIGTLPDVNRPKFRYLGDTYYLVGYPSYFSSDLVNWTELILNDPIDISTDQIYDIIMPQDQVLLALTGQSKIYRSTDNGENWSRRFQFNSLSFSRDAFCVVGSHIICTDNQNWFYSTDNGHFWRELAMEGLPKSEPPTVGWAYNVTSVENILFAATHFDGIYQSFDFGESWHPFNEGLESLRTFSLLHSNDQLFLGGFSSGVWHRTAAYENVSGFVFHDENNNGIQDLEDLPFKHVLIQSTSLHALTKTDENGLYTITADILHDTIRCIPPSPYTNIQPPYYEIDQSTTDLDFGIYTTPGIHDLCVTVTNTGIIHPGRDNNFVVTVKNVGTTPLSPIVKLVLSNGLNYISSHPNPAQQFGDTTYWELPELPAYASQDIVIIVFINTNTPIGSFVSAPCVVYPIIGDQNESNNTYTLVSEVFSSYDPNDKQAEPADVFSPEDFDAGERITYTVRFQNLGNFMAQHVRIIDTISENLDLTTFEFIAASHPVVWDVRGQNILEFYFEDIMLPDAMSDDADSHGFAKFSIKPKAGLPLGEVIENNADIYFDINEPVKTNTVSILYDEKSGLSAEIAIAKSLTFIPNPANGECQILFDGNITGRTQLKMYDLKGNLVEDQQITITQSGSVIDLQDIVPGLYTVSIIIDGELHTGKIVVQ